ncbi:MAG: hypothetical protein QNJ12_08160 [Ilumatobacter sp.]|uniref:hypothetical protein n=1 Tax=Ilumatobacter sp. TaxID=1967498 RepID=UPI0026066CAD|nr:hypothetical protein [Ilumatobacter sp.]MDJ0768753.1 hypothetical protein [Ilumatobacter sp.]
MKQQRLVVVLAATSLIAAACGGDDDSAGESAAGIVVDGAGDAAIVVDESPGDVATGDGTDGGADDAGAGELVIAGSGGDAAASDGAASTGDMTEEEQALAFAQCMRDEGIEEWPDPTTSADGSIDLLGGAGPGGGGGGLGGGQDGGPTGELQAAFEVCGEIIEGASFLPGGGAGGGFDDPEFQDQFLEFAQCLRDNGLDVDDPDFGNFQPGQGGGGGGGLFGENFDPQDPDSQAAIEACQGLFGGGFGPGGGQGGNRGGEGN